MIRVYDKIYLYSPEDKEYVAEVREITEKAVHGSKTKIKTVIEASILKPKFNGDGRIVIVDDVVRYSGWNWSTQRIPPIRKNAIVIINHHSYHIELSCRVLGLSKGTGGYRPDEFVYEGIKVMKNLQPSLGRAGVWKGHRFTASTEEVIKIVDEGEGDRLMTGPYLSNAEERELFAKQFGDEDD